jgi:hypothetical protein
MTGLPSCHESQQPKQPTTTTAHIPRTHPIFWHPSRSTASLSKWRSPHSSLRRFVLLSEGPTPKTNPKQKQKTTTNKQTKNTYTKQNKQQKQQQHHDMSCVSCVTSCVHTDDVHYVAIISFQTSVVDGLFEQIWLCNKNLFFTPLLLGAPFLCLCLFTDGTHWCR